MKKSNGFLWADFIISANECVESSGSPSLLHALETPRLWGIAEFAIGTASEETIEDYFRSQKLRRPSTSIAVRVTEDFVSVRGKASYARGFFRRSGREQFALRVDIPRATPHLSRELITGLRSQLG